MGAPKSSKPKKGQVKASASPPSRRKLWAFRLTAAFLLPLLCLVLLEAGLRLGGFGYSPWAVVRYDLPDGEVCGHNYRFGWQFFPRNIARDFNGFVFETPKPPDTCRIFVLGASAAMGMPAPSYNVARLLEVMLNDRFPGRRFEVHTAAMVAINSHAVRRVARDCARYEPDFFLIYMGNNEVVGPYGPGSVFAPVSPSLKLIRAHIAFKGTRTGQLFERTLRSVLPRGQAPRHWNGLGMFLEKQVRADSPALDTVYRHFEENLRDICQTADRAGARVLLSTVAANLKDCPPLASLHRPDLDEGAWRQWESDYHQGIAHEEAGDFPRAVECYLRAAAIDPTFADLLFRLGRCHWHQSQFDAARDYYEQALEQDTLRFRADCEINAAIRRTADRMRGGGVFLVDGEAALAEASPHHTPGEELFYEHVHLNFEGGYVLARAFFDQLAPLLSPEPPATSPAVPDSETCARRLAYTDFERRYYLDQIGRNMLTEPPFTNQLYHVETMERIGRQIETLSACLQPEQLSEARAIHEAAVHAHPDDWQRRWQYALFLGAGPRDLKAQEEQLRCVLRRCPYNVAYVALGRNLSKQDRLADAREVFYSLLALKPNEARAHAELAEIYKRLKNTDRYIEHLEASLAISTAGSVETYGALAQAYEQAGRVDKAVDALRRAIAFFPNEETASAHATLGLMLKKQGKHAPALREMKIALELRPEFADDALFQSVLRELESQTAP